MKKHIQSLLVAISIASISSSIAAISSTANYVGIFGTNSSQTNFVIPAGDSVYVARWLQQTDVDGNYIGYASASINSITKTVTNSIVYIAGKPKIVSVTNFITNSCNFVLNDPQNYGSIEGILVPGPATISTTSTAFQYKYFPKKLPFQILLIQAGSSNPVSITIPAGQKLHQINVLSNDLFSTISGVTLNGFPIYFGLDPSMGSLGLNQDVYGPANISFIPIGDGGMTSNFYFSYILINSDATNIPIITP